MTSGMGYIIASTLASAFTAIVGYIIYKRRAGVDVEAERARAQIRQNDAPLQALAAEAAAARQQVNTLMSNHLEHDRQDRDKLLTFLAQGMEVQRAMKDELVAHRQEERERAASFHERLNEIDKGIARIEGRA